MLRCPTLRLFTRSALAALGVAGALATASTPAAADERTCLTGSDAQAIIYSGQARKLSELRGGLDGELIRADLCRQGSGYVYVVTTLGANGKVTRRFIDANPAAVARPAAPQPMLAPVQPTGGGG
jgi:hypothetical protein